MKKVLIVEDEEIICDIMADLFRSKGYDVTSASTGNEASAKSSQSEFDVVISDVRMPDGDGIELANELAIRNPQRPFFIFVTGYLAEKAEVPPNVVKIFTKPVRFEDIYTYTESLFKKSSWRIGRDLQPKIAQI